MYMVRTLEVLGGLLVASLMLALVASGHLEEVGDILEAFLAGDLGELGIHALLFVLLASSGSLEVLLHAAEHAQVDCLGKSVGGLFCHRTLEGGHSALFASHLGDMLPQGVLAVSLGLASESGSQVLGRLGAGHVSGFVFVEHALRGVAHGALLRGFADVQVAAGFATINLHSIPLMIFRVYGLFIIRVGVFRERSFYPFRA